MSLRAFFLFHGKTKWHGVLFPMRQALGWVVVSLVNSGGRKTAYISYKDNPLAYHLKSVPASAATRKPHLYAASLARKIT